MGEVKDVESGLTQYTKDYFEKINQFGVNENEDILSLVQSIPTSIGGVIKSSVAEVREFGDGNTVNFSLNVMGALMEGLIPSYVEKNRPPEELSNILQVFQVNLEKEILDGMEDLKKIKLLKDGEEQKAELLGKILGDNNYRSDLEFEILKSKKAVCEGNSGRLVEQLSDETTWYECFTAGESLGNGKIILEIESSGISYGASTGNIDAEAILSATKPLTELPVLAVAEPTAFEAEGKIDFVLTIPESISQDLVVNYVTSTGTASNINDYVYDSGLATIKANDTSTTVSISLKDDAIYEEDEKFSLTLTNPVNVEFEGEAETLVVSGTIRDEDTTIYRVVNGSDTINVTGAEDWTGDVSASPSSFAVGNSLHFATTANTVTLDHSSLQEFSVAPEIFDVMRFDSSSSSDPMKFEFDVVNGVYQVVLFFIENYAPNGANGKRVFDVSIEGGVPEQFDNVDIYSIAGALDKGIARKSTAYVSDGKLNLEFIPIVENPAVAAIQIDRLRVDGDIRASLGSNVTVSEGNGVVASIDITLNQEAKEDVTVFYKTSDGTAIASQDYAETSNSVVFSAGETSKSVSIAILNDNEVELDHNFYVYLTKATGAYLAKSSIQVTIQDDSADTIVHRLNAGGPELPATDASVPWAEDSSSSASSYVSGSISTHQDLNTINMTDASLSSEVAPEALFQTHRHFSGSGSNLNYQFPVHTSGDYTVKLFLAETHFSANDTREFSVSIEGSTPGSMSNIDSHESKGKDVGYVLSHTLTINDGVIDIEFNQIIENPAIQGIEILKVLP